MRKHPRKTALQWENVTWSYIDLYEYSNAVANYFRWVAYLISHMPCARGLMVVLDAVPLQIPE